MKTGVVFRAGICEFAPRASGEIEGYLTGWLEAKVSWTCFRRGVHGPLKLCGGACAPLWGGFHWILEEVHDPKKVKTTESFYVEQTLMTGDSGWDNPRQSRWQAVWSDRWHLGTGMLFTAQPSTWSAPWGATVLRTGHIWASLRRLWVGSQNVSSVVLETPSQPLSSCATLSTPQKNFFEAEIFHSYFEPDCGCWGSYSANFPCRFKLMCR